MFLALVLLLGVANFTLYRAVTENVHPLLGQAPWLRPLGGKFSLTLEFVLLLGAALLTSEGAVLWAWLYLGYTLTNAGSAWLILSGRV